MRGSCCSGEVWSKRTFFPLYDFSLFNLYQMPPKQTLFGLCCLFFGYKKPVLLIDLQYEQL
jgi:hypothetical protein